MGTQELVPKAKVRSVAVFDRDGIKLLLERTKERFPRLLHPWMDAGYNGRGKGADWAERAIGLDGTDRATPTEGGPGGSDEGVGQGRSDGRLAEGAAAIGSRASLSRRWIVEHAFSWSGQNGRVSKDYERLTETSEAFVLVATTHLMGRRLTRARGFSDGF